MRASGASDITIRDHIKEKWRSAGNVASAEVIILHYIVLYSTQSYFVVLYNILKSHRGNFPQAFNGYGA